MAIYGYTRASTKEQKVDRGRDDIEKFCKEQGIVLDDFYSDKETGRNFNRPDYIRLKNKLVAGDTVIVPEVDRIGRDRQGLIDEVRWFKKNHVRLIIIELPTSYITFSDRFTDEVMQLMGDVLNDVFLDIFAAIAELELKKNKKRQREGIEAMKKRGEFDNYGRKNSVSDELFLKMYEEVLEGRFTRKEALEMMGIKRSSWYNYTARLLGEGSEGGEERDILA